MEHYAVSVSGKTVTWIGVDWDLGSHARTTFTSVRKTTKDAKRFAEALWKSGTACLIG